MRRVAKALILISISTIAAATGKSTEQSSLPSLDVSASPALGFKNDPPSAGVSSCDSNVDSRDDSKDANMLGAVQ